MKSDKGTFPLAKNADANVILLLLLLLLLLLITPQVGRAAVICPRVERISAKALCKAILLPLSNPPPLSLPEGLVTTKLLLCSYQHQLLLQLTSSSCLLMSRTK